jgi:hypothetical protein
MVLAQPGRAERRPAVKRGLASGNRRSAHKKIPSPGRGDRNHTPSLMKIVLGILTLLLVAALSGYVGWRLGMRDGISLASGDMGMTLTTYHLARKNGDIEIADRAIDHYTVNVVCNLLDGRHHFPLVSTFPSRSDKILSQLKAVWTPPKRRSLFPTPHYPHTSRMDYGHQFSLIEPAKDVTYMKRYLPPE